MAIRDSLFVTVLVDRLTGKRVAVEDIVTTTDRVPTDLSGQAGKTLVVNGSEDGYVYAAAGGSFDPSASQTITGDWGMEGAVFYAGDDSPLTGSPTRFMATTTQGGQNFVLINTSESGSTSGSNAFCNLTSVLAGSSNVSIGTDNAKMILEDDGEGVSNIRVSGLVDALDDTAAAAANVPVDGIYHTSGTLKIRLV